MVAIGRVSADLDFVGQFATRNRREDPVSANPSGLGVGDSGRVWYNTTTNRWMYWDGTAAIDLRLRSNQIGTQVVSTLSDFDSAVRAYRLDQLTAPNTALSIGSQRLTSVADPEFDQDAATRAWVLAQIAALTSGQVIKGAVRCAATTNISLSSPGATIDGVSMSNGDIVLLAGQTTGSQNGPYVWTGAAVALTRATNWDTSGEAALGSYWVVREGSHADQYALLTNDTAITLGTDTPVFTFIGGITITGSSTVQVSGGVVSAILATNGGLIDSSGIAIDSTKYVRRITGVIPISTSGIVTVSGADVTINHGLSNFAPSVVIRAHTSPYTGYSTGDLIGQPLNGFTSPDDQNVVGTLPAAPGANAWFYSITG